jgi:hypothetical protein
MSPTAAASPRLLPRTPTFALPVLYPQLLCSSFLAPCLCFLFLGYLSLYLSLSSLLFTHRPLRLPPPDAIYFDSRVGGRGAMGCGATSKSEKARMATRLKPLLRWRASQPAREKDRTDRCRPSAAAARQFLPTAGLLIKGLGTRIGPSLRSLNLRRGKQRMKKTNIYEDSV